jgi:preprotein translocase subunit SecG
MFIALVVLHILTSIVLVLVVLLQSGRGAELGAAFGGVGQSTFGRTQATFISKLTTVLAVVFMATSLSLSLIAGERPSQSLLQENAAPAPAAQPVPAPAVPAAPAAPGTEIPAPVLPQTAAPASK